MLNTTSFFSILFDILYSSQFVTSTKLIVEIRAKINLKIIYKMLFVLNYNFFFLVQNMTYIFTYMHLLDNLRVCFLFFNKKEALHAKFSIPFKFFIMNVNLTI